MHPGGERPDLVSIVISAWNNWPDLEMAISSALGQSYGNIEVIVVDNSSADATSEEVPGRFAGRVRYVRQSNRGCAGAHNTGFGLASGEFVQFLSGDDVLAPNKIEKQVQRFLAVPEADIVYGDIRIFQDKAGAANWTDQATQAEDDMLGRLVVPGRAWSFINALGVLFRRRALIKIGPWDESLYVEDLDYWLRAAWAGCCFVHCPGGPMGFYRLRPGQKSGDVAAMVRGVESVLDKALSYITREPYRSHIAAELARVRFRLALSTFPSTRAEALAILGRARSASPQTVSALLYVAACATIFLPGGVRLSRSGWFRPVGDAVGRLLRFSAPKQRDEPQTRL